MTNEELAVLIKNGEKEYISELWDQVYKLLYIKLGEYYRRFQNRFIASGVTLEDLQQECYIIMLDMVEAYEPEKGYKFTSYIDFSMKNHLWRNVIKFNRQGVDTKPLNNCFSLDTPMGEDQEETRLDLLPDETANEGFENINDEIYRQQLHNVLNQAMNDSLTDRQKQVIERRYYKNQTLNQIAAESGSSLGYIGQIEKKALQRLREHNERTAVLEEYRQNILSEYAYKNTGVCSFRNNRASSVEIAVEKSDKLIARYIKEHKEELETLKSRMFKYPS